MCWSCDHPSSTPQDYLNHLRSKINKNGWAVQYVENARMPFGYTAGLTAMGLPELIVTGIPPGEAWDILNWSADFIIRDERTWRAGEYVTSSAGHEFVLVDVQHPDVHLCASVGLYGPITALQLVWPDARGHRPWCPDFNGGRGGQAVLGPAPFDDIVEAG